MLEKLDILVQAWPDLMLVEQLPLLAVLGVQVDEQRPARAQRLAAAL